MLLISLVGEQPIPILIPVFQSAKAYSDILLFATKYTSHVATQIVKLIIEDQNLNHLKVHPTILVSPYDMIDIQDHFFKILDEFEDTKLPVTINLTGGTKIMSLSAQQIAASFEIPLIYVSSEKNKLFHFKGNTPKLRHEDININISIDQYLRAYGLETSTDISFNPNIVSRYSDPKEGDSLENTIFNKIHKSNKFDDVGQNIWIRKFTPKGEIVNELDVVATRNGKLIVCSCKDRSNIENDFIYELSALSRRESAGIYCGKILALGKKTIPTQAFIDRARDNNITLVFGNEIDRIEEYFINATR